LRAGRIKYLLGPGHYKCPFCVKAKAEDYLGMLQHAIGVGVGSGKTAAHVRAKHAAYGLFLQKYVVKPTGKVHGVDAHPSKKIK
jgi:hypothetical protein